MARAAADSYQKQDNVELYRDENDHRWNELFMQEEEIGSKIKADGEDIFRVMRGSDLIKPIVTKVHDSRALAYCLHWLPMLTQKTKLKLSGIYTQQ